MIKSKMKILLIGLFLTIIGASIFVFTFQKSRYETISPRVGRITEAVYGLGRVKSIHTYELVIGVMLKIKKLFVHEGQEVSKNDPLILLESGISSAPFNGVITMVNIDEGETALPSIPLIKLEDLSHRLIEVSLEQQAALKIKRGQKARVSFESLSGKYLSGIVRVIFPRNDEFIVHIDVEDLQDNILPGMTADVSIEIGSIKNALMLPVSAISNGKISIKRKNKWVKEKVEVGHVNGLFAEIKGDNLSQSDLIRVKRR